MVVKVENKENAKQLYVSPSLTIKAKFLVYNSGVDVMLIKIAKRNSIDFKLTYVSMKDDALEVDSDGLYDLSGYYHNVQELFHLLASIWDKNTGNKIKPKFLEFYQGKRFRIQYH